MAEPTRSEFREALDQLQAERGISREQIIQAIETALLHAYRREFVGPQDVRIRVDANTGSLVITELRTVTRLNTGEPDTISLAALRHEQRDALVGERIERPIEVPASFRRIAAQTVKQIIVQKMREAERDQVFEEYRDQEGELVSGIIKRIDSRAVFVDLEQAKPEAVAVLPLSEQVPAETERYQKGQRLRFLLLEVQRSQRGPQLLLSRSHRSLLRRLFEMEVPEVREGTVDLHHIAREAGSRSKVAVEARRDDIDPIGACVGLHRTRIQAIVNEVQPEKVDVIAWDPEPARYVANALSPARVLDVLADRQTGRATVLVTPDQMSLAIGKEGLNARLAVKLTGWRIDIRTPSVEPDLREDDAYRNFALPGGV